MKFFVLIPTYNEAENINRTLGEVLRVFEEIGTKHDMHVLVTDANSKDGTGQLVRDFQSTHPNVHLIVEEAKRGLGAAYTDAMREAFETHQAEAIITFDADLSHDINLIPKIVEKIAAGANFVAGSRYKKGGSVPEEWVEVLKGLKPGEEVVTGANFLIDSEARFKAAVEAYR
jgi:dolichol-phosphate mannosyltransferase